MQTDCQLDYSEFLSEVQAFAGSQIDDAMRQKVMAEKALTREEADAWQRALHARGWAAVSWPVEYGGTGWPLMKQYLFKREMGRCLAPTGPAFGLQMVGPVIYTFGNEAQKAEYLPAILTNATWWCQGFSEPGAGSDLAGLQAKAEDKGDYFLLNGQKIWTSYAHLADMMFLLARTEKADRRQDGISFLLLDMNTPGIRIRPIVSINGAHSLNEVFFEDVRIPKTNLIGKAGKGWTYAKFLLSHERLGIGNLPRLWQRFAQLRDLARSLNPDGIVWIDRQDFRMRLASLEIDLLALGHLELQIVERQAAGASRASDASILKVAGTELLQRADAMLWEIAGRHSMVRPNTDRSLSIGSWGNLVSRMLHGRAASIYGGTNEVQRDLIARAALTF